MRNTQRIPFSAARASRQGRPRPSGRRLGESKGLSACHCASVKSMLLIYADLHTHKPQWFKSVYEITSSLSIVKVKRSTVGRFLPAPKAESAAPDQQNGKPFS